MLDYIKELKEKGVVKRIGLSLHTPSVTNRILDMRLVDVLMFNINPLYDYGQGDYAVDSVEERYTLYRRCEKEDVGIVVMKPFCGEQLPDAAKSAFGIELTKNQRIQYVLDKPGVICAVPGFGNEQELLEDLQYLHAPEGKWDYSVLAASRPKNPPGTVSTANIAIPVLWDWILHSSTSITTWLCWTIRWRGSTI